MRKRLFAFRLVHFEDVVDEIQGLSISARALELTDSALSLFYKYKSTEEDDKIFNEEILPTLSSFLKERLGRRNDSLEARLYPIIRMLMAEDKEGKKDEFDNDTIYDMVRSEMDGHDIPDKPGLFYADDPGMIVKRSAITKILREKFKAIPARVITENGDRKRGHRFSSEALERIRASYEDEYEIKIIVKEDSSARVDRPDRVLDQYEDQNNDVLDGESTGGHEGTESSERENVQEVPPKADEKSMRNSLEPRSTRSDRAEHSYRRRKEGRGGNRRPRPICKRMYPQGDDGRLRWPQG